MFLQTPLYMQHTSFSVWNSKVSFYSNTPDFPFTSNTKGNEFLVIVKLENQIDSLWCVQNGHIIDPRKNLDRRTPNSSSVHRNLNSYSFHINIKFAVRT